MATKDYFAFMSFQEAVEHLLDYVDGCLSSPERRKVELALASYPNLMASYAKTASLCRESLRVESSKELGRLVCERIRAHASLVTTPKRSPQG